MPFASKRDCACARPVRNILESHYAFRNGASVEDIEADMNVAFLRLRAAEKELKDMSALNKVRN